MYCTILSHLVVYLNTFIDTPLKNQYLTAKHLLSINLLLINQSINVLDNNSNLTYFLHSGWLFGRLYTSIKAMRKNTPFSP